MGRQILRVGVEGSRASGDGFGLTLAAERPDYLEFRMGRGVDPNMVLKEAMALRQVTRFELAEPSLDQIFVERVGAGA